MSDFLLELGKNPQARKLIQSLGLPIPVPQDLKRSKTPFQERPIFDANVAVAVDGHSPVLSVLAETLAEAGANPYLVNPDSTSTAAFRAPGEAFGRPPVPIELTPDGVETLRLDGLVLDATGFEQPSDLRRLYDVFHPLMRRFNPCAKVVVVGRPPEDQSDPGRAAAQRGLDGFVRSLAKELGRRGGVSQLIYIAEGAEARLGGTLRFLLSSRSAYVSGQPLRLSAKVVTDRGTPWVYPFEGRTVLVTGGARGIGAATARRFAEEGAKVVVLDRPNDDGPTSKLARTIGGVPLLIDITDADAPHRIADFLLREFGGVDVVVHNAGVTRDKTLARMKPAYWEQAVDINLGAVIRITDVLLESALRNDGRIICLSSVAGIAGNLGQTNYAASKAGIIGYVKCLADVVAERGIGVNAVAPGFIETRLTAAMPFGIREVARRMNNLGQGGRAADVAEAITFLASPAAWGLSGQTLRVCGGSLVGA